jgi:hypothetical protein
VLYLLAEFAIWVVLTAVIALLIGLIRPKTNRTRSNGHAHTALHEAFYSRINEAAKDCCSELLRMKVMMAGQSCCEADVRDANELRMSLRWAKTIWPKTLTAIEVSRSGKSVVFTNELERDESSEQCWRTALKPGAERVELGSLGETLEPPLIDMIVREWL